MDTKQFVDKYLGQKVDADGFYGAQCVDLFRQFNKDVFGFPHTGGVEGAKDLWENYGKLPEEKKYYEQIRKEGTIPLEGDVVVFGKTTSNKYGHVAIVLWASRKVLVVLEQDGLKQDGAKVVARNYDNVLGYLRRR